MATSTYAPTSSGDHYLNLNEAVALGYGAYQTLRRYIDDGRLPAVKIGSRVKVLRADLDGLAIPCRKTTFEDVERAVQRIVASAPPLTNEQVRKLSTLVGGAS